MRGRKATKLRPMLIPFLAVSPASRDVYWRMVSAGTDSSTLRRFDSFGCRQFFHSSIDRRYSALHPSRDFDTHQVQGFGERLTHDIHYENIEKFPVRILFGNDPIPVIEEIESLSESERMFRQSRRFKRDEDLMPNLVHTQREIDEFPDIMRLVEIYPQFRIVQHLLDTAEIEPGIALAQFMEDVIAAYRSILDIGSGFAIEIQCFLEIERDNRRAGKLQ